jgi:hypothetical protein
MEKDVSLGAEKNKTYQGIAYNVVIALQISKPFFFPCHF